MSCLDGLVYFVDPSYILKGKDVYTSCLQVPSTNKTDHNDITEIYVQVVLNTINQNPSTLYICHKTTALH
jgi:hypothetical protein